LGILYLTVLHAYQLPIFNLYFVCHVAYYLIIYINIHKFIIVPWCTLLTSTSSNLRYSPSRWNIFVLFAMFGSLPYLPTRLPIPSEINECWIILQLMLIGNHFINSLLKLEACQIIFNKVRGRIGERSCFAVYVNNVVYTNHHDYGSSESLYLWVHIWTDIRKISTRQ
jgi:hypothetical protein